MLFDVELRVHVMVEDVSIAEAVVATISMDESYLTRTHYVKNYLCPPLQELTRTEDPKPVDMEYHVAVWRVNKCIFKDGRYFMWVSPDNAPARGLLRECVVKQLKKDVEERTFMQWIFEDD